MFLLSNSFEDNLALFRAKVEQQDAECAKVLFENLATLTRGGDAARDKQALEKFHHAVLSALESMSGAQEP